MKKANCFVAGLFFFLVSVGLNAQTKTDVDFFVGRWSGIAEGTPSGDMNIAILIERKEGKPEGTIKIGDQENVKFSRIEEQESSITLYFTSNSGYDVTLNLEKKDENHVNGSLSTSMAGTFGFTGERLLNTENN